jgi:ornithine carbamoyltransferase
VTFEKGIQLLGGQSILFPSDALDKKEEIKDVMGYLNNWTDCVIVRHSNIELISDMEQYRNLPIINAMTSINHPCEVLADLYALSKLIQSCPKGYELSNISIEYDINKAVINTDVIITDSISKAKEDFLPYQITKDLMKKANHRALLNPCPPFTRGEEVSEDAIDSDYFVGYEFKKCLLYVQQAIILNSL